MDGLLSLHLLTSLRTTQNPADTVALQDWSLTRVLEDSQQYEGGTFGQLVHKVIFYQSNTKRP